ncbi:MAG: hypothetical protein DRO96_02245 [Candidatus Aenigmatarchaeota archaeon]|nr:MAG: hypothetical protein DRO96_02245 [Candidatus Aenigmarchaeota archaeon]
METVEINKYPTRVIETCGARFIPAQNPIDNDREVQNGFLGFLKLEKKMRVNLFGHDATLGGGETYFVVKEDKDIKIYNSWGIVVYPGSLAGIYDRQFDLRKKIQVYNGLEDTDWGEKFENRDEVPEKREIPDPDEILELYKATFPTRL